MEDDQFSARWLYQGLHWETFGREGQHTHGLVMHRCPRATARGDALRHRAYMPLHSAPYPRQLCMLSHCLFFLHFCAPFRTYLSVFNAYVLYRKCCEQNSTKSVVVNSCRTSSLPPSCGRIGGTTHGITSIR